MKRKKNHREQLKNCHVLVLEDSLTAMIDLKKKLSVFFSDELIHEASDYHKAVEVVSKFSIDMAFIDLTMPQKTGMDFIVDHLSQNPETKDIPVVVTTSSSADSLLKKSLSAMTHRYLHKPICEHDLEEAICNAPLVHAEDE